MTRKQILLFIGIMVLMPVIYSNPLPTIDLLWDYNDPVQTEVKFRALLPQAQQSGDISYLSELRTQIARTLGLQEKFQQAHALLDTVALSLESINDRAKVRYLLERGRVFSTSQKLSQAEPLFQEAFDRAVKAWLDLFAVDAAHMAAVISSGDTRRNWNDKAISIAENSNDPKARRWVGSLYYGVGCDFFDAKRYDSALTIFIKTRNILMKTPGQLTLLLTDRCAVGKTYRMLGKYDSALVIQQDLKKEYERSGREETGYICEEIGENLLGMKRDKDAIPYFAEAYKKLSGDKALALNQPARLERLKRLGGIK